MVASSQKPKSRPRIDQLNLNQLKVFSAVFVSGSMTKAAQALYLTQSGVSQHIKALEDWMGQPLFDRVRQKLVPTHAGKVLHGAFETGLSEIGAAIDKIVGVHEEMSGEIALGMPVEFGANMVAPILARLGAEHPGISFKMDLGFGADMSEGLLSGELDFALVDDVRMDRRIVVSTVCDEFLELVISPALLAEAKERFEAKEKRAARADELGFLEQLPYIEYQKDLPLLGLWFKHHFRVRTPRLKVCATVQNARAVATLIQSGLGAGLLPRHLVDQLAKKGASLVTLEGGGQPLKNAIGLAILRGRTLSPAARFCVDTLQRELGA